MKPRNAIILLMALVIVVGVSWILILRNPSVPTKRAIQATPAPQITAITPSSSIPEAVRQLPGGPYQPADPRWAERRKLRKQDPQYEWKTPIEFYGKVLDQNQQPIPAVEVTMEWTDMSEQGSSTATTTTDAEGKFSISGIQGKNFGVRSLEKDGYVEFRKSNPHSLEYPGFWEPTYHEPDPNNPVIFYMRRKGQPAPLVSSEGKFVVTFGASSSIPLPEGVGLLRQ